METTNVDVVEPVVMGSSPVAAQTTVVVSPGAPLPIPVGEEEYRDRNEYRKVKIKMAKAYSVTPGLKDEVKFENKEALPHQTIIGNILMSNNREEKESPPSRPTEMDNSYKKSARNGKYYILEKQLL